MSKLQELNQTFQDAKIIGATGEQLASGTIKVIEDIDSLLLKFNAVSTSETKTSQFIEMAGVDGLQYAGAVAQILGEARTKIEALG